MKNTHILIALANLKRKDCIHKVFTFKTFNRLTKNESFKKIKGVSNCGTMGCLAGELPALDKDWYFTEAGELRLKTFDGLIISNIGVIQTFELGYKQLMHYFDLSSREIGHIFYPDRQDNDIDPDMKYLGDDATFEEVQNNLRRFLKIKGIIQ